VRPIARWTVRIAAGLVALALAVALGAGVWLRGQLVASLPRLDGELALSGLTAAVRVERDALGVPTLRGASRTDLARATGFLHAQERLFQMDLLRRNAAGELAALLGPALVPLDRRHRVHRFRSLSERDLGQLDEESRALLAAYAAGVNAGLAALGARPPEYLLLRADPEPWRPEDTLLVVRTMYLELQDGAGARESTLGLLHELLPAPLAAFLDPPGTEWDAPLLGEPFATPPAPPPEVVDLRARGPGPPHRALRLPGAESVRAGSNAWAVAGAHGAGGRGLLANDIHLRLAVPNIWYRASLAWTDAAGAARRVTGITLPGAPPVIAGTNGSVAWGFTNSYVDLADLVLLDVDPDDSTRYRTPGGWRKLERSDETIAVRGADDERLEVLWTIWGPVVDRDHRGRPRALRWVAHDPEAVDLGLFEMESARDLDEALAVAARTALPTQNLVAADRSGRIGWSLMGPLPLRFGLAGRSPASWAEGDKGWNGYLPPAAYPRVVDPPGGSVWSANQRMAADGILGDGGYALGARARRIRDVLRGREGATEQDMLALQLDDRADLFDRWRDLLLEVVDAEPADARRRELRRFAAEGWSGRASVDSVGYRIVRGFRLQVAEHVLDAILAPCLAADERFDARYLQQIEGPLWRLVTERPMHLLDPRFRSWDELLLAAADAVARQLLDAPDATLAGRTWGERNTVRIRHPLGRAVPLLSRWLDLPPLQLPGDMNVPRVQGVEFGASMRLSVSPGREGHGLFHMPGGQSGHPLSPYYRAGHEAWVRGEALPLLPGPTAHRLTLTP
jgi:penicillin amidase